MLGAVPYLFINANHTQRKSVTITLKKKKKVFSGLEILITEIFKC